MTNSSDNAKRAAAYAAAQLVENGMKIGLGTGSTASFFIECLSERYRASSMKIQLVATSERTVQQAKKAGLPLCEINQFTSLDLAIDGADEIDPLKRMIKGGGGALLREKIIAGMSQEMILIVDKSKLVDQLGAFPLPLEIVPFAHQVTLHKVRELGYDALLRLENKAPYVTDNGNYILDISFKEKISSPELDEAALQAIPGVVETGFFFGLAGRIFVGHPDGSVTIIP